MSGCKRWGMPCTNCGHMIDEHGGDWPGINGPICHGCWEIEADDLWWSTVRTMDAALHLMGEDA